MAYLSSFSLNYETAGSLAFKDVRHGKLLPSLTDLLSESARGRSRIPEHDRTAPAILATGKQEAGWREGPSNRPAAERKEPNHSHLTSHFKRGPDEKEGPRAQIPASSCQRFDHSGLLSADRDSDGSIPAILAGKSRRNRSKSPFSIRPRQASIKS